MVGRIVLNGGDFQRVEGPQNGGHKVDSTCRRCLQIRGKAVSESAQDGDGCHGVAKTGHDGLRGCPVVLSNETGPGQSQGGGRQIKEEAGKKAEESSRA